ncbi:class I SAM-dependent methyltransferase [Parendozoicomonas haliclonae]|uniref:Bifunctional 3-demethylubiquinone-9 3-methyltransferase/ 2-octaprenyl-6-hydroxy phenol methylase n=1 Tax=Parendozoicomonas haliclonae TaxID=1960125 RepID=A0A1X7AQY4_9GAMM|nr:methyltransferase domain-containing protein [Parendozoicomonas haliclonae]SMA50508.1 bifunctional 3-demethylubiquinone-9 3-methyltransferase/ 2-octaprenyl-6-hydroxy phenol methylase [Parendozoicomonas haliclonae]
MPCQFCHHPAFTPVSSKDAKTGQPLPVGMCDGCGLVQVINMPSEEELNSYYREDYRQDYKGVITPRAEHVFRAGNIALERLDLLSRADLWSGRLLDVGAGGGEFTYLASRMGYTATGVEPNKGYSGYAKETYGCDIRTGYLQDIKGRYDIITLFHVLEHLRDPVAAFAHLHSLLNPQGHLLVEVPWIETKDASPNNIFFRAHLYYFSIETLKAAASRHFECVQIDTRANLKILFRSRRVPAMLTLPDSQSVSALRMRLNSKGWMEYLFAGGGLIKPLRKQIQRFQERKVRGLHARSILDRLLSPTRKHCHVHSAQSLPQP